MPRKSRIDPAMIEKAREVAATTKNANELRAAQAILLPGINGATLEQTAALLGVSRITVLRLQSRFRTRTAAGKPIYAGWGGRRREILTHEGEKAFLKPWIKKAREEGIMEVSMIQNALEKKIGRKLAPTIIYRMLSRHGWQKQIPNEQYTKIKLQPQLVRKKALPKVWYPRQDNKF